MFLTYFDESGDSGLLNSPTRYFVLSGLIVHESHWLSSLDKLIDLRRRLRITYGIASRPEIKSTDLRRGQGPLVSLRWSLHQRMRLYRGLMVYQARYLSDVKMFAIAIDKANCHARGKDPRETAWVYALQRIDRYCSGVDEPAMIFPDEGHGLFIKRLLRKNRRFHNVPKKWGGGSFKIPMTRIVEDPSDRQSHDSYFIQCADWNAYAAHRSMHVDPQPKVDPNLWGALGGCLLLDVNKVNGGPPGIVVYP